MVLKRLTLLVTLIVRMAVDAMPQWSFKRLTLLVTLIVSVAVVAMPQWSLKDLRCYM